MIKVLVILTMLTGCSIKYTMVDMKQQVKEKEEKYPWQQEDKEVICIKGKCFKFEEDNVTIEEPQSENYNDYFAIDPDRL